MGGANSERAVMTIPSAFSGFLARMLPLSRVEGTPTSDEMWGHSNFSVDTGGQITELARGNTLGYSD